MLFRYGGFRRRGIRRKRKTAARGERTDTPAMGNHRKARCHLDRIETAAEILEKIGNRRNQRRHHDAGGGTAPGHAPCRNARDCRRSRRRHDRRQRIGQELDAAELDDQIHQNADAADQDQRTPWDVFQSLALVRNLEKRKHGGNGKARQSYVEMEEHHKHNHDRDARQRRFLLRAERRELKQMNNMTGMKLPTAKYDIDYRRIDRHGQHAVHQERQFDAGKPDLLAKIPSDDTRRGQRGHAAARRAQHHESREHDRRDFHLGGQRHRKHHHDGYRRHRAWTERRKHRGENINDDGDKRRMLPRQGDDLFRQQLQRPVQLRDAEQISDAQKNQEQRIVEPSNHGFIRNSCHAPQNQRKGNGQQSRVHVPQKA